MGPTIELIGQPAIIDESGEVRSVRGFQSWALLARLVLADREPTRQELGALLFPDTVDPLGSVRWSLAELRRAVGSAEAFTGDPVRLNLPDSTRVDVLELQAGTYDVDGAGELLEGIHPRSGPELDIWLLVQRQRVAGLIDAGIRNEVIGALCAGDHDRALRLAEQGVSRSVLDERAHVLLIKSLVAAGRHDAAAAQVEQAEALLRAELGVEPSAALRSAARRHVADPPQGVSTRAIAASLLESGLAAISSGAVDAGLDCLRRASSEAERSGDGQLLAHCSFELGSSLVHAVRSHDDEGALLLRTAADLAEREGDHRVAAGAWRELGYVDALAGRRPAAAANLDRAQTLAAADPDLLAGIRSVAAFNLADWGRAAEGLAGFEEALALAREAGNQRREAWTLGLGGWAHLRAGDVAMAQRWLHECLELVDALRWVAFGPWPRAVLAEAALQVGSGVDLHGELEETFALSCQLADPCWEGAAARVTALFCLEAGELDAARRWIVDANARCLRETDVYVAMQAAILATDVRIALAAGDPAAAEATARTLVALAAKAHMDDHLDHAMDCLAQLRGGDVAH